MIRVLLDTNVLLSGIIGVERPTSAPGAIIRAWRQQQFELVTSDHIRAEVERNLTERPYFADRLTADQVIKNLESLALDAIQAELTTVVTGVASHPEDDLVLAAAVSASVDFLVSGDRQLLALGHVGNVPIVPPHAFLAMLESTS